MGALLTGVFAEKSLNGVFDGALSGNPGQVVIQGTAVLAAIVYSGVMSFVLLKLDRPRHPAARQRRRTRATGSTSRSTAKRPTCTSAARPTSATTRAAVSTGADGAVVKRAAGCSASRSGGDA